MTYKLIFLKTNSLIAFLFWDLSKVPEQFIPVTLDHERMLNVLKGSDREWIAVLPPNIEGKYCDCTDSFRPNLVPILM
jgi:hypothetical protein